MKTLEKSKLSTNKTQNEVNESELEIVSLFNERTSLIHASSEQTHSKLYTRESSTFHNAGIETKPGQELAITSFPKVSYLGLLMAIVSSFMFSVCSLAVKILAEVPALELVFFRLAGILIFSVPILIKQRCHPCPKGYRLLLLLRALFGTVAICLQYYAFQHMPLGNCSVIVFSSPAIVAIFARLFLKEKCGFFQTGLIILTFLGVLLISRPPFLFGSMVSSYDRDYWWGVISAIVGTVVTSAVLILVRALKELHYSITLTAFSLVGLIATLPWLVTLAREFWIPVATRDICLVGLIGTFSFGGQFLLTKALQKEEVGPVSIARTSDIIFAFLWQLIFFQAIPDGLTIIGAALVTSCIGLLGIKKWIVILPESSSLRKRLNFLFW